MSKRIWFAIVAVSALVLTVIVALSVFTGPAHTRNTPAECEHGARVFIDGNNSLTPAFYTGYGYEPSDAGFASSCRGLSEAQIAKAVNRAELARFDGKPASAG